MIPKVEEIFLPLHEEWYASCQKDIDNYSMTREEMIEFLGHGDDLYAWQLQPLVTRRRRNYRLSLAKAHGRHTSNEWELLRELTGNRCLRCDIPGLDLLGGAPLKDHVIPISWSNSTDCICNLQPMCRNCNSEKSCNASIDYVPVWARSAIWYAIRYGPLPYNDLQCARCYNLEGN